MNINMNINTAAATNDTVGITVLKKALDIQAQSALLLINSIPQPQQSAASFGASS